MGEYIGFIIGLSAASLLSFFFILPPEALSLNLEGLPLGDNLRILGGVVVAILGGFVGGCIGSFFDHSI